DLVISDGWATGAIVLPPTSSNGLRLACCGYQATWEPSGVRDDEPIDALDAGRPERDRACLEGGSGRGDVVEQDHGFPGELPARSRKCVRHVAAPGVAVEVGLRRRRANPTQRPLVDPKRRRDAGGQRSGQEGRLVEATLPLARRV